MHADHRDFGPVVASLSLGAAWPMRFRPRNTHPCVWGTMPGDEVATLPRRSVLVLAGAAHHLGCTASTARNRGARDARATLPMREPAPGKRIGPISAPAAGPIACNAPRSAAAGPGSGGA